MERYKVMPINDTRRVWDDEKAHPMTPDEIVRLLNEQDVTIAALRERVGALESAIDIAFELMAAE